MRRIRFGLVLFLTMVSTLTLQAQGSDVRLTMTFKNETLPQAFLKLEANSSYRFLFTYDDMDQYKVNGKVTNMKFFDIVDYVLKGTPLEYKVDGKFINVTQKNKKEAQTGGVGQTVGGYVVDNNGDPVIGAQLRIPGTNIVAVTDLTGAFHFDYYLNGKGDLQVSYVGMKTLTVPIKKEMRIVMEEDAQMLQDVVVTGIFRKARESYTGSVSTIDKEQLEQFRGQNLLQTLKNVDASINFGIDNLNGSNPNNLPNINIRGNSSLPTSVEAFNAGEASNPNTPLIIMDGFEISLQKLMDYNDEEIESINILKDAAATAIYGSRGANGVIVVISKQPEPGKLKVNLEAGIQFEVPDLTSYHLLNATDKLQLEKQAGLYDRNWNYETGSSQNDLYYKEAYQKRLHDVLSGIDTDWLSKPLRTGVGQRYNLRVEGGSNEFRWSADAQYNQVEGAMKGSNRRTFTGAITLLYKYN